MVAGFTSERWPASNQNPGRFHLGTPGRIKSESAIRAGAGGEQVAPQANFRHRRPLPSWHERPARKRQPPVCGRLYQSDLETTGGRGREEAGRDRVERRLRSDPEQPVLARTRPIHFFNFGMQMLQQPGKITILYDEDHAVRHLRMNQTHPAQVTPSWYGDSVGHYEGDTLVIDTVGVKADRPFAM